MLKAKLQALYISIATICLIVVFFSYIGTFRETLYELDLMSYTILIYLIVGILATVVLYLIKLFKYYQYIKKNNINNIIDLNIYHYNEHNNKLMAKIILLIMSFITFIFLIFPGVYVLFFVAPINIFDEAYFPYLINDLVMRDSYFLGTEFYLLIFLPTLIDCFYFLKIVYQKVKTYFKLLKKKRSSKKAKNEKSQKSETKDIVNQEDVQNKSNIKTTSRLKTIQNNLKSKRALLIVTILLTLFLIYYAILNYFVPRELILIPFFYLNYQIPLTFINLIFYFFVIECIITVALVAFVYYKVKRSDRQKIKEMKIINFTKNCLLVMFFNFIFLLIFSFSYLIFNNQTSGELEIMEKMMAYVKFHSLIIMQVEIFYALFAYVFYSEFLNLSKDIKDL